MDENKGRRYVADRFPAMPVVSSLTLFISAAVRLERDRTFLRDVVDCARRTARMAVPKSERDLLSDVLRL
jgi:heme exporter protein D